MKLRGADARTSGATEQLQSERGRSPRYSAPGILVRYFSEYFHFAYRHRERGHRSRDDRHARARVSRSSRPIRLRPDRSREKRSDARYPSVGPYRRLTLGSTTLERCPTIQPPREDDNASRRAISFRSRFERRRRGGEGEEEERGASRLSSRDARFKSVRRVTERCRRLPKTVVCPVVEIVRTECVLFRDRGARNSACNDGVIARTVVNRV